MRWDAVARSMDAPGPSARCYHTCTACTSPHPSEALSDRHHAAAAVLFGGSGEGATLHNDAWLFRMHGEVRARP